MQASASGHASSTSSTGITPSPSGTETGPGDGVVPGAGAVLQVQDLDRRREPPRCRGHVVADPECVGGVEAEAQVVADLLEEALDLARPSRSPWFSSASTKAVVARGGARLAEEATTGSSPPPARWAGPPATMRITGSPSAAPRGSHATRSSSASARSPNSSPSGAPHESPSATSPRLGEELGRREVDRVAEEARLQQREVELEPATPRRRRRASRAGTRAAAASRRAGLVRAAGGRSSCRRRPGRHQSAFVWTSSSLCAPRRPCRRRLPDSTPGRAIPPPTGGHRDELEALRRERGAGGGEGLDGVNAGARAGTSTIQASGTPSSSRRPLKAPGHRRRPARPARGTAPVSSDQSASAPAASPMFHSTGCSR